LAQYNIQIVISMTNVAAKRLLLDDAGNPSHIAEAAMVSVDAVPSIEIDHKKIDNNWSVVEISRYNPSEIDAAYKKYSQIFNVQVHNDHRKTDDPFLLRLAMEQCEKGGLPTVLDEPSIIEKSITRKSQRAVGLPKANVPVLLTTLAESILEHDAPIAEYIMLNRWGIPAFTPIPSGLFEAALLMRTPNDRNQYLLDFYYSRERDFVLSYWARDWGDLLSNIASELIADELNQAVKTNAGTDALRWFLSQPEHLNILKCLLGSDYIVENDLVHRVLLSCTSLQVIRGKLEVDEWVKEVTRKGIEKQNPLIKVEAAKLLVLQIEEYEDVQAILEDSNGYLQQDIVINLLRVDEEYPIDQSGAGNIVMEALQRLHSDYGGANDEHTRVTGLLESLIDHPSLSIRLAAAKAYGHVAGVTYLKCLNHRILHKNPDGTKYKPSDEHAEGIIEAIGQLQEMYYGSLCPGWLEGLSENPEQLAKEYSRMSNICLPIIRVFTTHQCTQQLLSILESLEPDDKSLLPDISQPSPSDLLALKYQLHLPLDETDIIHNNQLLYEGLE
jgi:hypothetical protein